MERSHRGQPHHPGPAHHDSRAADRAHRCRHRRGPCQERPAGPHRAHELPGAVPARGRHQLVHPRRRAALQPPPHPGRRTAPPGGQQHRQRPRSPDRPGKDHRRRTTAGHLRSGRDPRSRPGEGSPGDHEVTTTPGRAGRAGRDRQDNDAAGPSYGVGGRPRVRVGHRSRAILHRCARAGDLLGGAVREHREVAA